MAGVGGILSGGTTPASISITFPHSTLAALLGHPDFEYPDCSVGRGLAGVARLVVRQPVLRLPPSNIPVPFLHGVARVRDGRTSFHDGLWGIGCFGFGYGSGNADKSGGCRVY